MQHNPKPSIKKKFPWVEIISIVGALAWFPFVYELFKTPKIHIKVISQYSNFGNSSGIPSTMLLYKLGVMSEDKKFDLYNINANVKIEGYGWAHFGSSNPRLVVFTDYNHVPRKLNIDRSLYLNNYVVLKKDEPVTGYLLLTGAVVPDRKIEEISFIFHGFRGDSSVVNVDLKNADEKQMLYDDDIWMPLDDTSINRLPRDLKKMYHRDMDPHLRNKSKPLF